MDDFLCFFEKLTSAGKLPQHAVNAAVAAGIFETADANGGSSRSKRRRVVEAERESEPEADEDEA